MSNFIWDKETDPEKIKVMVRQSWKEKDENIANLLMATSAIYAHQEFISLMVSKENRANVFFTRKPSHKEINILINSLRTQMEIHKDDSIGQATNHGEREGR